MRWPAHTLEIRLATKNATKIRRAFRSVLNGNDIAQQWADAYPTGGSISPQMARDWAHLHINPNKKPMQNALARVYAEGYVVGDQAAKYMVAHLLGLEKAPRVSSGIVDWANWKPGNRAAAALVRPKGSLKRLLDSQRIAVSNEVFNTKIDRIGTVLAKGLDRGWATTEIAKALNTVITDPQQALVIAQTEMSRAVSVATRDNYTDAGIEQVEWLVAEGCEDCQENADASPIGIDETFPSGDTEPPAHPNCMCSLAPYYDMNAPEQSGGDLIGDNGEIQIDFGDEDSIQEIPLEEDITPIEEPVIPEPTPLSNDDLYRITYDTPAMGSNAEDLWLNAIQNRMGYNALPTLVKTESVLDDLATQGWKKVYRGIGRGGKRDEEFAAKSVQAFKTGEHYAGNGIYGNGTYTTNKLDTAMLYAEGKTSGLLKMAISPKAKIIDVIELQEMTRANLLAAANKRGFATIQQFMSKDYDRYTILSDIGRFAASKGYDAISVPQGSEQVYYVVLNRAKVAVVE